MSLVRNLAIWLERLVKPSLEAVAKWMRFLVSREKFFALWAARAAEQVHTASRALKSRLRADSTGQSGRCRPTSVQSTHQHDVPVGTPCFPHLDIWENS
jgi:hypothetical protein